MTGSTLEAMAREAGFDPSTDGEIYPPTFNHITAELARFAALVRAEAEARETERLSIIADELIAGLGPHGRGLAELIREGVTALESHAAHAVRDVRADERDRAAVAAGAAADAGMSGDSIAAAIRTMPPTNG